MKKAAARAKSTGVTDNLGAYQEGWLSLDPISSLSRHLENHLCRAEPARRKPWSRRTLAKLALESVLVALGVRRAILIDASSLSVKECLATAEALQSTPINESDSDLSNALRNRLAVLHHGPTGQTFLVNRDKHMWADRPGAPKLDVGRSEYDKRYWIDVRRHRGGTERGPCLTKPSPHVQELIALLYDAVVDAASPNSSNCLVIEATVNGSSDSSAGQVERTQQLLVGTALAGWLLGYSSVYCLEAPTHPSDSLTRYSVRSIAQTQTNDAPAAAVSWHDIDADSMTNCLDSQPLVLFRVLVCLPPGKLELLAFSVPLSILPSAEDSMRPSLQSTYEQRLSAIISVSELAKLLAHGSIEVEVSHVCLDRVAL